MRARAIVSIWLLTTPLPALARTWHVNVDGTGDAPTIRAAMDSAQAGDIVQLDDGEYDEVAIYPRSGVSLSGNAVAPWRVTIRPSQSGTVLRAIAVTGVLISDLTVQGASSPSNGGAVNVVSGSSVVLQNCRFIENHAQLSGGGVACRQSQVVLEDCVFRDNTVGGGCCVAWGGGLVVDFNATAEVRRCVFVGNQCLPSGGPIWALGAGACVSAGSASFDHCLFFGHQDSGFANERAAAIGVRFSNASISNCVFASNVGSGAVFCDGGTVDVTCSNMFEIHEEWNLSCGSSDQQDIVSRDPLFCDPGGEEPSFYLHSGSPCLPAHSNGCGLIGPFGLGDCNTISVSPLSWGRTKASYR